MIDRNFKQSIYEKLKSVYFNGPNDLVDVSDGPDDSIHLVIVSNKFDGKYAREKHDLIWGLLTSEFPEDVWQRISLAVCKSPEDIKAGV